MNGAISEASGLPKDFLAARRGMPLPSTVLMCPPDHFDVVDVKNPFMAGREGTVDREAARRQWRELAETFRRLGLTVETVPAVEGLEDMVFAANQVFAGLDGEGRRVCMSSRMTHASRQLEVAPFAAWFGRRGYEVVEAEGRLEGGGDALWHPGRGLVWGGHGPRSDAASHEALARVFGVPVLLLELVTERFYHLDTCFAALDERTCLVHPPALSREGLALIRSVFARVVEVDEEEAGRMACNAAAFGGRDVVLQRGSPRTAERLRGLGFRVAEVETSEFVKSGGSVFCMKKDVF